MNLSLPSTELHVAVPS